MAGQFPITLLAWLFTALTLVALGAAAWRFRGRPVAAMIAAGERRTAFHRDTLAALDAAITSARAEGRTGEADRLIPTRREHLRALAGLDAARERPRHR